MGSHVRARTIACTEASITVSKIFTEILNTMKGGVVLLKNGARDATTKGTVLGLDVA